MNYHSPITSFSSLFPFISACFFIAADFSARISDTLRAACVVPFGTARSESGMAAGAAVIVVVRERRRAMVDRVGKRILLECVGTVVVGRREGVGRWMW